MLNRPHEYRKMAKVEGDHWWYRSLHQLVATALAAHPLGREARVLDAGCGTGGLLMFLQRQGYHHLSGFDVSPDAVAICRERGLPVAQHDLRALDRLVAKGSVEAIVSNDTLYYFSPDDQARILRKCWNALVPGGFLVLNLPAFHAFRGIHDLSVGISRRFTKADIGRLFPPGRFKTVGVCHWPFLLSPAIYLTRLAQRLRLRYRPPSEVASDINLPPFWLNGILEYVTRTENAKLRWKPFGSSLFVVGQKRE